MLPWASPGGAPGSHCAAAGDAHRQIVQRPAVVENDGVMNDRVITLLIGYNNRVVNHMNDRVMTL